LPSRPSSNTHQVISENSKTKNAAEVIGVMDGRQITAEDLRRILRAGGKL